MSAYHQLSNFIYPYITLKREHCFLGVLWSSDFAFAICSCDETNFIDLFLQATFLHGQYYREVSFKVKHGKLDIPDSSNLH